SAADHVVANATVVLARCQRGTSGTANPHSSSQRLCGSRDRETLAWAQRLAVSPSAQRFGCTANTCLGRPGAARPRRNAIREAHRAPCCANVEREPCPTNFSQST